MTFTSLRQAGGTIGVAVLGTVLNSVYRSHVVVAGLPAPAARLARDGVATGVAVATQLRDVALARSAQSAFVTSLDVMLCVCGGIALGAVLSGCSSETPEASSIPWNQPADWEGQIPGMGTNTH